MYFERSVIFEWGKFRKSIQMPWDYEFINHEVRRPDGSWVVAVNSWDGKEPDGREVLQFPYQYVLKSGEIQNRIATVHVERRQWRRKWLQWTKWFSLVRTSIDVRFDAEVGERTGSWKGGCMGCGWDALPGESPEQCLRRMERERKF